MMLHIFLLDDIFEVAELADGARMCSKAFFEERTSDFVLSELDDIHGTAFVWSKSDEFVDNFADKRVVFAARVACLALLLLGARHF